MSCRHRWQAGYLIGPSTRRSLTSGRRGMLTEAAGVGRTCPDIPAAALPPAAPVTWTRSTCRLEIGRNDRTSSGSMSDFFRSGMMYAALKTSGTTPFDRDLLNNSVRNGAMTSTTALRCTVGGLDDYRSWFAVNALYGVTGVRLLTRDMANITKVYVGTFSGPTPRQVGRPPRGPPGSALLLCV